MGFGDNEQYNIDYNLNNNFKIDATNIVDINQISINSTINGRYYELDYPHYTTSIVSASELLKQKQEIEEKMNNFLSFLEMKGIIKKEEFNDFLESLNVVKKMEQE